MAFPIYPPSSPTIWPSDAETVFNNVPLGGFKYLPPSPHFAQDQSLADMVEEANLMMETGLE